MHLGIISNPKKSDPPRPPPPAAAAERGVAAVVVVAEEEEEVEEERKTSGTLPDRGISAPPYPAARRIHSSKLWARLFLKRLDSTRLDQSAQETCGGESTGVPKNLTWGDKLRFSCTGEGGLCLAPCNKKKKEGGTATTHLGRNERIFNSYYSL